MCYFGNESYSGTNVGVASSSLAGVTKEIYYIYYIKTLLGSSEAERMTVNHGVEIS